MDKDARYMAAKCRRLAETLGEYDARTLRDLAAEYERRAAEIANENANQNTPDVVEYSSAPNHLVGVEEGILGVPAGETANGRLLHRKKGPTGLPDSTILRSADIMPAGWSLPRSSCDN